MTPPPDPAPDDADRSKARINECRAALLAEANDVLRERPDLRLVGCVIEPDAPEGLLIHQLLPANRTPPSGGFVGVVERALAVRMRSRRACTSDQDLRLSILGSDSIRWSNATTITASDDAPAELVLRTPHSRSRLLLRLNATFVELSPRRSSSSRCSFDAPCPPSPNRYVADSSRSNAATFTPKWATVGTPRGTLRLVARDSSWRPRTFVQSARQLHTHRDACHPPSFIRTRGFSRPNRVRRNNEPRPFWLTACKQQGRTWRRTTSGQRLESSARTLPTCRQGPRRPHRRTSPSAAGHHRRPSPEGRERPVRCPAAPSSAYHPTATCP
jgi:hypothetical protein